jgi:hypothetical protein
MIKYWFLKSDSERAMIVKELENYRFEVLRCTASGYKWIWTDLPANHTTRLAPFDFDVHLAFFREGFKQAIIGELI